MNEKKLKKLDLIKKKKPYYYYAYKTISCPMQFSVFLHEQCIEEYMIWKPSTINDYYNYEYNDTTPSLCIVYNNNEIISSSVSMNFMELFEKIKSEYNDDYTYKFYYIDLWHKGKDEEYFRLLKSIKLMIKKYLLVKNEL
jgi:hypothetical protein